MHLEEVLRVKKRSLQCGGHRPRIKYRIAMRLEKDDKETIRRTLFRKSGVCLQHGKRVFEHVWLISATKREGGCHVPAYFDPHRWF